MNEYKTKILPCEESGLIVAAALINCGEIVAMPTETVYGLAANALDEEAVKHIFKAKGRPSDNPLIVHLQSCEDIPLYTENVPDLAYELFAKFSPGPLTIVLEKKAIIPDITSGGLSTVGIRIPSDEKCRRLIDLSGVPIAAPSANLSGKPSPTTAAHVMEDMNGKIPLILDGGDSIVGIESTVISLEDGKIRILRPGFVTAEDLSAFGEVITDSGVTENIKSDEPAKSPGMKYKHYAPKCEVILVNGSSEKFAEFIAKEGANKGEHKDLHKSLHKSVKIAAVVSAADSLKMNSDGVFAYGDNETDFAHNLFALLRQIDDLGFDRIYVKTPKKTGIGLAVYNRLIRAAGFNIIDL
jgi:L-threonylcarbamoyladenylate synthase